MTEKELQTNLPHLHHLDVYWLWTSQPHHSPPRPCPPCSTRNSLQQWSLKKGGCTLLISKFSELDASAISFRWATHQDLFPHFRIHLGLFQCTPIMGVLDQIPKSKVVYGIWVWMGLSSDLPAYPQLIPLDTDKAIRVSMGSILLVVRQPAVCPHFRLGL